MKKIFIITMDSHNTDDISEWVKRIWQETSHKELQIIVEILEDN